VDIVSANSHASERAAERYGIDDMTPLDMLHIAAAINSNKAVCLSRGDRRGIHLVRYRDIVWKVCFDHVDKIVVTILPPSGSLRGKRKKRKMLSKNQLRKRGARAMRAMSN